MSEKKHSNFIVGLELKTNRLRETSYLDILELELRLKVKLLLLSFIDQKMANTKQSFDNTVS